MIENKPISFHPLNPAVNVAVSASAGAGKTYLLVNRIVRLLIEGADPGSILAITFTRKAANEMLERVQNRLWYLHCCQDTELQEALQHEFNIQANDQTQAEVRQLYQKLLFAEPSLKISTFHAFCQDLLQYFALDADLPPNFELTEQTYLIADAAWDKLFNEVTYDKKHRLRPAIDCLFEHLGSLFNTRTALIDSFLEYRSDWWSFTDNQADPLAYATQIAQNFFKPSDEEPEAVFLKQYQSLLMTFSKRIQDLPQQIYQKLTHAVSTVYDQTVPTINGFSIIQQAFLTAKNEPSKNVKHSQALEKKLGANTDSMLHEYATISAAIIETLDIIKRNKLFRLHTSWYQIGYALLEHYQNIKRSRHQLDFSDLEWLSYKLLNKAENAQWIQYKLDSRINHLLIDEFQDTNSTQWQMLLPLLQEMASGDTERQRSVFLVGDTKQSIYSFRRANPELQATATDWLQKNIGAHIYPLNKSWRSSSAVMQAVNHVFMNQDLIKNFSEHQTHKENLWGQVECWPLFGHPESKEEAEIDFRNPLTTPPHSLSSTAHDLEGAAIAQKITELIESKVSIGEDKHVIEYKDIFILLRKRTHANSYEQALADKNIPFVGTEVGTLLDCQEVDDIICLLNFLVTPFNNMALAQLIKSPIFNGTDDDLITLAQVNQSKKGSWFEKLQYLCENNQANKELFDTYTKLKNWSQQQHFLPVHDLLNIIYHEGDIIERYNTAMPDGLQSRARANLQYLLELALNIDSGRYPSIMRFLQHIEKLKLAKDNQKPNSLREQENQNRVHIMTIHAAKGLEAPVVFLADSNTDSSASKAYSCFINWPTQEEKVKHFFLLPKQNEAPECLAKLIDEANNKAAREDSNLLYVAMTRAIHMLFVTGSENSRAKNTWHNTISNALPDNIITTGKQSKGIRADRQTQTTIQKRSITHKASTLKPELFINPSIEDKHHVDYLSEHSQEEGLQRGNFIHHILYCIGEKRTLNYPASFAQQSIATETLNEWYKEAQALTKEPQLQYLYAEEQYDKAFNEVPILIKTSKGIVNGIIDRLVITEESAIIIDYKTHSTQDTKKLQEIANSYQAQMNLYKESVKKLYPNKNCTGLVIFTYSKLCYEIT